MCSFQLKYVSIFVCLIWKEHRLMIDEWLNRRKLVANQKRHWSQWSTEFPSEVADVSRSTSEILRGEWTAWKHRREWVAMGRGQCQNRHIFKSSQINPSNFGVHQMEIQND